MKICVFLGPTLTRDEARTLLPHAVYLPPAGQADLLSALTTHRPQAIALIDGVFGQSLSVWHKEILYALSQGVAVYGASSMGALRAVECAPFGMVGVGEVVRAYREGHITGDDEVALAHAGPEDGFLPLSEPLVNLRATLTRAVADGVVDAALHDRVIGAAKALFFPERTRDRILAEAGLSAPEQRRIESCLTERYVDVKAEDARALLSHLARLETLPPRVPFTFNGSHFFDALYDRDRTVSHGSHTVPLSDVANHAALHRRDFAEINAAALARAALVALAPAAGIGVDEESVAAETRRFCARRGLDGREAIAAWCRRNDLTDEEFGRLMTDCAIERAMRRWVVASRFLTRTTTPVLNELRLRGLYPEVVEAAAVQAKADAIHHGDHARRLPDPLEVLLPEHLAATGITVEAPLEDWASESGFRDTQDLRIDLARAARVRKLFQQVAQEAAAALAEGDGKR